MRTHTRYEQNRKIKAEAGAESGNKKPIRLPNPVKIASPSQYQNFNNNNNNNESVFNQNNIDNFDDIKMKHQTIEINNLDNQNVLNEIKIEF
jgi:hypothetical protein